MREITYAQAIKEAMCEEMRRDKNLIFIGEDIGYVLSLVEIDDSLLLIAG